MFSTPVPDMFAPPGRLKMSRGNTFLKPTYISPQDTEAPEIVWPRPDAQAPNRLAPNRSQKENQFLHKYGQLHHAFDAEKAPYPVSYNRSVLELESMAQQLLMQVVQTVSFVQFPHGPPTKSLDLGCGLGSWVIDAAKEWTECQFVGFDLMNVQVDLRLLDPSLSSRIQWVHGNFLTTKLPFDDDEFDHVRMRSLAKGVPENKWGPLFAEVNRVLRTGGAVEITEDDIIFPTLPRWFTSPLHVKARPPGSAGRPGASSPMPTPEKNVPNHDHALLESLYYAVFEHRFINLRPTAVLPVYFTAYFGHVYLGPQVNFPMPAIAPPQPHPKQNMMACAIDEDTKVSLISGQPVPFQRATSLSFSSTLSSATNSSTTDFSVQSTSDDTLPEADCNPMLSSLVENTQSESSTPTLRFGAAIDADISSVLSSSRPRELYVLDASGSVESVKEQLENELRGLSERSLAMQLYYSYQGVLGCQEAMWEELKDRLRNRKESLIEFGWEADDELEELEGRKRFERLVERYRSDMHARVALWCSLLGLGWPLPARELLTKAELIEEERIQQDMLEAWKHAAVEDLQTPSRSARVFVGFKSMTET